MAFMTKEQPQPNRGLIWERLQQSPRSLQPALNRDQIVRAAIEIADTEGAQAITMRRIAAELDAAAMSLYRHVFSKEDLLDLMLDQVFGEIALPVQPSGDWRADLSALAYATRSMFKLHPWLIPLLTSRPTIGPNYLGWFEFSLATVANLGFDITTMAQIVSVLAGYVTAVVGYEVAEEQNTQRTGLTEEDKRMYATPYVQQIIASGRYPNFARFFSAGVTLDPEQGFAFGLGCLLDGLAARLPAPTE
jgi:AcrR family transcriptional regulator